MGARQIRTTAGVLFHSPPMEEAEIAFRALLTDHPSLHRSTELSALYRTRVRSRSIHPLTTHRTEAPQRSTVRLETHITR